MKDAKFSLIKQLVQETLQSTYCVMQVDARDIKVRVKKKDGSDWFGSLVEAEKLATKLNKKSHVRHMNLKYVVEPMH